MTTIHRGGCLCGAVRFIVEGERSRVTYCHCSQCRRQTGHHYATSNVRVEDLRVEGSEAVQWYASSQDAKRGFCSTCGSALFWKHDANGYVSILAGAFDSPSGLVAKNHIYTADKGDYYEIVDGLPQSPGSSG